MNPLPQDGPDVGDVTTMPSGGRIDTDSNATLTPCYDSESNTTNTTESNGTSNSNQSSSRNTSVSCRPNLRSNSRPSKTLTNNTSGDEGDDDPRKQSRERLKHQCETEDKHDTFFDTLDSTPDLSSRDCSNSKLDISEMNPTPLVKVTPSESEESSGNKVPVVRRRQPTRSECLYKSVFHEHQQDSVTSPRSTRPRSYSEADLNILNVSLSGDFPMNTQDDNFFLYRDKLLESSFYMKSTIQQLMRRLWKQKVSVLHVDSLPQDDISYLSLIGDTLSPISRPVISPIRRLFSGINKIIKTDMQVKDELNNCLITRSKGSVCRLNIKSILPSNYDQNAPVGIVNLLSPLHITILPNSKKHFIYNLASMDAKSGSLALLNSNLMEHAKLLVPAQRYYLDNEYLFLTLFKAKQGLESDTTPKKVVANILRNQLLEKTRFESSQEADRNTKNVSLEIEGSSCHSWETIHDIINYNSENDSAPTNVKRQQQRFFESGSYK